jgi:hypothetical protein
MTVVVMLLLTRSTAYATSGFARQTGLSCEACHTVFPELTPFGRKFKLNGYVFINTKQLEPAQLALSEFPPVSMQLQASHTMLGAALPDTGAPAVTDLSQRNSTQFPQALSLFYTGKVSDRLGAFLQLTWSPATNSVGIDNSDVRFAGHGTLKSGKERDFIYGVTLNNNPTSEDVWNSTPAWGYPFISADVGVPSVTKVLLDGQLAQQSVGLGGYVYFFNHLYLEVSGYRSAPTGFTNKTTGGPGPLDSTAPLDRISGVAAPYWRATWEQDSNNHSVSVGTYGISAATHPTGVGESGPTNTVTDVALDAQYQYISDNKIFSASATWIREMRTFNNASQASNLNDRIDTARVTGSYFLRRRIGGSVQGFSTTGTSDPGLYSSGTAILGSVTGRPDTQGAALELDYLPSLNTKLGAQYTMYANFDGGSHNYDGFGRNASDNNTLLVFLWTAF